MSNLLRLNPGTYRNIEGNMATVLGLVAGRHINPVYRLCMAATR